MGTSASPSMHPIAAELENGQAAGPSPQTLSRRVKQRRQIQGMIAASYLLDGIPLLIYAHAGVIPPAITSAYLTTGLSFVVLFTLLSETGVNDRFRDHYLIVPQSAASMLISVVFAYLAPQIAILFLCSLFTVFGFGSLRASWRQTALIWTATSLAMAALFLDSDQRVGMPDDDHLARFATLLVFILGFGRCMFIGIFSNSLLKSLYESRLKLKDAYRRIEELAELDELTGSFNRRSIMRLLEEQIAHAHRLGVPFSIALIDLDLFKRINDAYGHPTGDEVLRTFAITVFANIRAADRFGRYGGEEFLLTLPGTDEAEAVRILDRLREIIAGLDWSALLQGAPVTLSAGVATLHRDENADALLARADGALYEAKARGRDRIIHA
jgi:diguanylate cyclase